MKSENIKLLWPVSKTGYFWVGGTAIDSAKPGISTERWLTNGLPPEAPSTSFRIVEPFFMDTALFLNSSLFELSEESIKEFAQKYGMLGDPVEHRIRVQDPNNPDLDNQEVLGESFEGWRREIKRLRHAVQLCFSILNKDPRKKIGVGMFLPLSSGDSEHSIDYELSKIEIADVDEALHKLKDLIPNPLHVALSMQLFRTTEERWLKMAFEPTSLLAGLWFQFADAVSEHKFFRQCKQCFRWFEIEPGIHRISRVFCSDSCKYKAYQGRQEAAVKLNSEGMSVEDIAKKLNSNPGTIEGWIKGETKSQSRSD